jgi:hypothetical protein
MMTKNLINSQSCTGKDSAECVMKYQTATMNEMKKYQDLQSDYFPFIIQLTALLTEKGKLKAYKRLDRMLIEGEEIGDKRLSALYKQLLIICDDFRKLVPKGENKAFDPMTLIPSVKDIYDIYSGIRQTQIDKAGSIVDLLNTLQLSSVSDLSSGNSSSNSSSSKSKKSSK